MLPCSVAAFWSPFWVGARALFREGRYAILHHEDEKRAVVMIDLYAELKAVVQALDAANVPYALCGGLALLVYQRPRATVDIDLILPPELVDLCVQAVAPLGFRAHPRRMRLLGSGIEMLRFYKVDPGTPDVLTLDCLLATHPTVAEAWRSRVRVPFEEHAIWVVSAAGLIALKRLRGSPLDLLDIQALEALGSCNPEAHPGSSDAGP
jgi:hypothetical protein